MTTAVDVLIFGGGPAGTSAALGILAHSTKSVAVVEHSALSGMRVGEHVSSRLFGLLEYLGVPSDPKSESTSEHGFIGGYSASAAWGSDRLTARHSLFTPEGETYQLDRERFDWMLLEEVDRRGGLVFPRTKCTQLERGPHDGWQVLLRHEERGDFVLNAAFVIDASGRHASISRQLGATVVRHDRLVAVGSFLEFSAATPLAQEVVIESTPLGWWYSATLPGHRMTVTFFSDADLVAEHRLRDADVWSARLAATRYLRARTSPAVCRSKLWARNAFTQCTDARALPEFLAVGDAAAAFDPISSLGIGFAVSSGCHGARAALAHLAGNGHALAQYHHNVEDNFQTYLNLRRQFYGREQRWPDAPFWQRRHVAAPARTERSPGVSA